MTTSDDLAKQIEDLVRQHVDVLRITAAAVVARGFAAAPPPEPARRTAPTKMARPRAKLAPRRAPEELIALGERFYGCCAGSPGKR
jgi:hypothetical protein